MKGVSTPGVMIWNRPSDSWYSSGWCSAQNTWQGKFNAERMGALSCRKARQARLDRNAEAVDRQRRHRIPTDGIDEIDALSDIQKLAELGPSDIADESFAAQLIDCTQSGAICRTPLRRIRPASHTLYFLIGEPRFECAR